MLVACACLYLEQINNHRWITHPLADYIAHRASPVRKGQRDKFDMYGGFPPYIYSTPPPWEARLPFFARVFRRRREKKGERGMNVAQDTGVQTVSAHREGAVAAVADVSVSHEFPLPPADRARPI